jgi:hypothetical protein
MHYQDGSWPEILISAATPIHAVLVRAPAELLSDADAFVAAWARLAEAAVSLLNLAEELSRPIEKEARKKRPNKAQEKDPGGTSKLRANWPDLLDRKLASLNEGLGFELRYTNQPESLALLGALRRRLTRWASPNAGMSACNQFGSLRRDLVEDLLLACGSERFAARLGQAVYRIDPRTHPDRLRNAINNCLIELRDEVDVQGHLAACGEAPAALPMSVTRLRTLRWMHAARKDLYALLLASGVDDLVEQRVVGSHESEQLALSRARRELARGGTPNVPAPWIFNLDREDAFAIFRARVGTRRKVPLSRRGKHFPFNEESVANYLGELEAHERDAFVWAASQPEAVDFLGRVARQVVAATAGGSRVRQKPSVPADEAADDVDLADGTEDDDLPEDDPAEEADAADAPGNPNADEPRVEGPMEKDDDHGADAPTACQCLLAHRRGVWLGALYKLGDEPLRERLRELTIDGPRPLLQIKEFSYAALGQTVLQPNGRPISSARFDAMVQTAIDEFGACASECPYRFRLGFAQPVEGQSDE